MPRARCPWALDSGGFSEISLFGQWTISTSDYAREIRRYREEIGRLDWAATMDYMCEPPMLAKTGKSIEEHQRLTIENTLRLWNDEGERVVPVLQGWQITDYWRHADMYAAAGIDLKTCPTVGVGSVCRRQATGQIETLMQSLAGDGLRLHGFGFKIEGIRRAGKYLASADSMAWSFGARRKPPLEECVGEHTNCANCMRYALRWRTKVIHAA